MAKYTSEFKENIVKKKLSGQAVSRIKAETGVSIKSIYQWINCAQNGTLKDNQEYPGVYSLEKKFQLLTASYTIEETEKGKWLRENGVHPDHLILWKKEIMDNMTTPKNLKEENKKLRNQLQKAEQEIRKKDKALAEAAALLILKKKYQHLWEDGEQ